MARAEAFLRIRFIKFINSRTFIAVVIAIIATLAVTCVWDATGIAHLGQNLQLSAMFNSALTDERAGGAYADFPNDDVKLGILNRTLETSLIGLKVVSHLFTFGTASFIRVTQH